MNYKSFTFFFCFGFFFISSSLRGQDYIRCATQQILEQYELQYPGTKDRVRQAIENAHQWAESHPGETRSTITIPVVVHVVYNTSAQNISDDQIKSQIEILNEDYSLSNQDTSKIPDAFWPVAGNCMIQFCLAAYDPNGDSTSGIIRTQTDNVVFTAGDSVKFTALGGDDAWPAKHYLNIWTCHIAGNVLGYATLPQANSGNSKTDGVVVSYKAFGNEGTAAYPFNLGRTATHEVGHWLGMTHTWGDDGGLCIFNGGSDDGIADTPDEADANYHCPDFPKTDECSPDPPGVMFMNYMDYSDDRCLYMFTQDQAAVMNGVLNGTRQSLKSSPGGCQGVHFANDAAVNTIVIPVDTIGFLSFQPVVEITNRGLNTLTSVLISYKVDGQDTVTSLFIGNVLSNESVRDTLDIYFTGEGDHIGTAWTSLPNNVADEYIYNDTSSNTFTVVSTVDKNLINMSPSPSSGPLTVTIQNPTAGDMDLRIINALGQVVQHHFVSLLTESTFDLDLTNFPTGVYFLYAKIGYDFVTKKVMIWR